MYIPTDPSYPPATKLPVVSGAKASAEMIPFCPSLDDLVKVVLSRVDDEEVRSIISMKEEQPQYSLESEGWKARLCGDMNRSRWSIMG